MDAKNDVSIEDDDDVHHQRLRETALNRRQTTKVSHESFYDSPNHDEFGQGVKRLPVQRIFLWKQELEIVSQKRVFALARATARL